MLDKKTKNSDEYELNKSTKLVVKNIRVTADADAPFYRTDITLKHKTAGSQPIVFNDVDEISDYLNNIDLDSDQTSLF